MSGSFRERDFIWQRLAWVRQSRSARRGFDAGGNHEWKSAFVVDSDVGMFDAEVFQDFTRLREDRVAVVRGDAGFEVNLEASTVARFEGDVKVGADVFAVVSGFGDHVRQLSGFDS